MLKASSLSDVHLERQKDKELYGRHGIQILKNIIAGCLTAVLGTSLSACNSDSTDD